MSSSDVIAKAHRIAGAIDAFYEAVNKLECMINDNHTHDLLQIASNVLVIASRSARDYAKDMKLDEPP